jgi:hypothetical protein
MVFDISQAEWLYLRVFSGYKKGCETCQEAVRNLFGLLHIIVISIPEAHCLVDHLFVIDFTSLSCSKDLIDYLSTLKSSDFWLIGEQVVKSVELLSQNEVHHVLNGIRIQKLLVK